jgi:hypothetical protein
MLMPEITQKLKLTFGFESGEFNVIAAKEFYHYVHQMTFTLHHKNHSQYIIYINPVEGMPFTQ